MSLSRFNRPHFVGLLILSGLLVWAALQNGPALVGNKIQLLPATICALAFFTLARTLGECLLYLAEFFEWVGARTGTGKSGSARWAKVKDFKAELSKADAGPFWGLSADGFKKLFIDFSSNAFVVGPSGSGKGHTVVVLLIFLIRHSKIIMDFKPELLAICKRGLEQLGQIVISLNPFGKYTSVVGETDCLNVLDVITDNLHRPGGLRHVFSDATGLSMQLYEDPPSAKGDDQYWRNGSRKTIYLTAISLCMMDGYKETLADASLLLDDPDALEQHLCSIAGVGLDGRPDPEGPYLFELAEWADHHDEAELKRFLNTFRAKVRGLLKQIRKSEKTFESFLEGAQQSLAPYGYGELSSAMGPTTFDFDAIKSGKQIINLFIVGDAGSTAATEKYFGLMQWFIQLKLKRHPNKDVLVYFINDEASNYSVYGLVSLMTWLRGFGIRLIQIFQNFPAYEEKHGKSAIKVLNSESEVKLYLPGQRCDETIAAVVRQVGEQSVMSASLSSEKQGEGLRENFSESGRKLKTEDEIRRSKNGILIVRDLPPIEQVPVSYSETLPVRELADNNPHHGKPFLQKVKLKLKIPR